MSERRDISVVVSTRDREARLGALLGSLRGQTLHPARFEVVVVDNGSRDGTAALLERERQRGGFDLRVLERARGEGPAAGRNAGWRAAVAEIVAFTDDDCEAAPGWLEALLELAESHPGAFIQGVTEPLPRERGRAGPLSRTQEITRLGPYYQTCNIAYPRALLERLGGFDEEAFTGTGGEDTDLAWRALASGAGAVHAPAARVHHAVNELGAAGMLRLALRWSDTMLVFRRHPGMRRHLEHGVFWKRSHALLIEAALGVGLGRRFPPALLLAYPYARELRRRGGLSLAPLLLLHDLLETYAAVRGGVRHRVLVI